MGKPDDISEEDVVRAITALLTPLGTSLRHYMPIHKAAAIAAMRKVMEGEREIGRASAIRAGV